MSRCVSPIFLRSQNRLVPCGRCWFCRSQVRAQWDFRLLVQASFSQGAYFLTLTYDDNNIPLTSNGFPTLFADHLTSYWKTLRNQGFSFSYFAIGEYGGRFGRPHYHVLLFMHRYFHPIYLKHFWRYGNVRIDACEPASIHYVCKFHVTPKERDVFSYVRRPFSRMSKGIGVEWLADHFYIDPPPSIRIGKNVYPFPRYFRKLLGISTDKDFVFDFPYIKDYQTSQYYTDYSNKKLSNYKIHSNEYIYKK